MARPDSTLTVTAEFYDYSRRFQFKVSPQVQTQLQRLLKAAHDELIDLRKGQQPGSER